VVCATRGYINAANLWWSGSRCILQHNEVYEINAFFLKWAFTMLATEVLKYNFLNFYIATTMLCILLKFVQVTLNK